MKKTLVNLTESFLEKYKTAIELRSTSSWGISDPRSIAMLGDQEIIYKKISYNVNDRYTDASYMTRCLYLPTAPTSTAAAGVGAEIDLTATYAAGRAVPIVPDGGISISIEFTPFYASTRHPISLDELYRENSDNTDTDLLYYKFLPNVNNISSDWMECNKAPKLHTSYKWCRIKPKTLFNHVLPISDTKGFCIYNENISQDLNMVWPISAELNNNTLIGLGNFEVVPLTALTVNYRPPFRYSFNVNRDRSTLIDRANHVKHTMFYPKSSPIGLKLINHNHNKHILKMTDCAITEGICASDLYAQDITDNDKMRKIHVLSHIMYNDNTFGYVPLRHLMLLDLGYNFIRYKITQENLYTTQKIISGSLLYDSEYHNESVYEQAYGVKLSSSLINKGSIVPRIKTSDNSKRPNITTINTL